MGKHPYGIDLTSQYPIAIRQHDLEETPEELMKFGVADHVEWEEIPEIIKSCVISTQEVIVEEASKFNSEKNKK